MEAAMAASAEVGRVGRRIIQRFWDPEPINNPDSNEPVWCLGRSYTLGAKASGSPSPFTASTPPVDNNIDNAASIQAPVPVRATSASNHPPLETPPDSIASSFDASFAYEDSSEDKGWPTAFLDDFESRIWMTYRTGFEMIPRSSDAKAASALSFTMRLKTSFGEQMGFSSDTGWGCMIRSGQSLLANALLISRLGRGTYPTGHLRVALTYGLVDWRRATDPDAEREVLALFADDPRAPYSLHNFVKYGATACGKYPGEWFGPSATARCIQWVTPRSAALDYGRALIADRYSALASQNESSLRVYSTGDLPDVYEDSFMAVAKPDGDHFHPTLILVCTRLGIDKINQVYEEALISTLQMEQSIGIAG
jgi:cysteine protease ATG4